MSVSAKDPVTGKYTVRWREGRHNRSRAFEKKGAADAWDRKMKDRKDRAGLPPDARRTTFADLYNDKFLPNHVAGLDEATQRSWDSRWMPSERSMARGFKAKPWHLGPKWGSWTILEITYDAVKAWHNEMRRAGASDATLSRAHDALLAILNYAWRANIIDRNPASQVGRPRYRPPRVTGVWLPEQVEAIRAVLLDKAANGRRDFRWARARDAVLVSLLAYTGLRPEDEGMAFQWHRLQQRTLLLTDTKTHAPRAVPVIEPLMEDLREWRLVSGLRTGLAFPRSPTDPQPISYNTWTREVWTPVVKKALGEDAHKSPYHLRHSCISAWIYEGHPIARVAEWAGHTPQVCLETYAHIFEDRDSRDPLDVEKTVRRVRAEYVSGPSEPSSEGLSACKTQENKS